MVRAAEVEVDRIQELEIIKNYCEYIDQELSRNWKKDECLRIINISSENSYLANTIQHLYIENGWKVVMLSNMSENSEMILEFSRPYAEFLFNPATAKPSILID